MVRSKFVCINNLGDCEWPYYNNENFTFLHDAIYLEPSKNDVLFFSLVQLGIVSEMEEIKIFVKNNL